MVEILGQAMLTLGAFSVVGAVALDSAAGIG